MLIARQGNFGVMHSYYLGPHTYSTHDINIVKFCTDLDSGDEHNYVIAEYSESDDLHSIGNRLIDAIENDSDLDDLKAVLKVAEAINHTEQHYIKKE